MVKKFKERTIVPLNIVTMTEYDKSFSLPCNVLKRDTTDTLSEIISQMD